MPKRRNGQLTPKEQAFVNAYVATNHITDSAVAAGYSQPSAHQIGSTKLRKVEIQRAIAARQQSLQAKVDLNQETVLKGLGAEATGDSPDTSIAGRVAAWMGIAKILGLIVDKKEIKGSMQHSFNPYADLSPEALEVLKQRGLEAEAQLRALEAPVIDGEAHEV